VRVPTKESGTVLQGACKGGKITNNKGEELEGPVLLYNWSWKTNSRRTTATDDNQVVVSFHVDDSMTTLSKITADILLDNNDLFPNNADPSKYLMK